MTTAELTTRVFIDKEIAPGHWWIIIVYKRQKHHFTTSNAAAIYTATTGEPCDLYENRRKALQALYFQGLLAFQKLKPF